MVGSKNKIVWVLFGIIILVIAYTVFFTNYPKKLYKLINDRLQNEVVDSQKRIDSIEALRQAEYLNYLDELNYKELYIEDIRGELYNEQQKAYRYEKELNSYRSGDFNERFRKFSSLVKKDSLE